MRKNKGSVTELPEESVAVQSICVVPIGKNDPDGGVQLTEGLGSVSSVTVTENE